MAIGDMSNMVSGMISQATSVDALTALPIPGEWIAQGGAVSLLMVVAWMVFTGRLVPRSVYGDMEKDRDQWREVALKAMGHADQLLPAAQIATSVTKALGAQVADATSDAVGRALAGQSAPEARS